MLQLNVTWKWLNNPICVVAISICTNLACTNLSFAQTALPQVFVDSTVDSSDVIGLQFVYQIKQEFEKSERYQLSTTVNQDEYSIEIVTLSDDVENGDEKDIAYSTAFIYHFASKTHPDYYLTSSVGTCGADRISFCAQTVVASFVNYMDKMNSGSSN